MTNPTTALTRAPAQTDALSSLTGSSRDPAHLTKLLALAAEQCHLLSPATSVGYLAEGWSVDTTAVLIHPSETFPIAGSDGKVGIGKAGLDRLALALSLSWDSVLSRRTDDARDPYYCSFTAVAHYTALDGSRVTTSGSKEIDLRDGSQAAKGMSEKQLRGAREFILPMAESKARNRAVRALGVKPAYVRADLAKPFICARAVFSGASSDPTLAREFALMRAQAYLQSGSHAALYGRGPRELPPAVGARVALPPARPAPPVSQVVDHDPDGVIDAEVVEELEAPRSSAAAPASAAVPQAAASSRPSSVRAPLEQRRQAAPARAPRAQAEAAGGAVFRFGRAKSRSVADPSVSIHDLEWYASAVQRSVDDPAKARWRAENQSHLDEVLAEMRRRDGDGGEADGGESSGGGDDFEAAGRAGGDDDGIPF